MGDYDQEFSNYAAATTSTGVWALVLTVVVCIAMWISVVPLIHWIRRVKARRREKKEETSKNAFKSLDDGDDDDDDDDDDDRSVATEVSGFEVIPMNRKNPVQGWSRISEALETFNEHVTPTDEGNLSTEIEASKTHSDYSLMDAASIAAPLSLISYTLRLLRLDRETRKLFKYAVPFSAFSLAESFFALMIIAVIGRLLGTEALTAYIMVYYALELSTIFLEGLLSSLTMVCSQAIGAEHYNLAGKYVQISVIVYQLLFIPQIVFWWMYTADVMTWLGFDEGIVLTAQQYGRVYIFNCALSAFHTALGHFLEVYGHEKFVSYSGILHEALRFALISGVLLLKNVPGYGVPSLQLVGILDIVLDFWYFNAEMQYVNYKGWLLECSAGMFSPYNPSKDFAATKHFLKTAIPLSLGYVLSSGEWEILLLLAGHLGPAEAATWAIVGELWSMLERIADAWGAAGEIRCALLLGKGDAVQAKVSTDKAMVFGFLGSIIVSGGILGSKDAIPRLITTDATLQKMVGDLIPLIAVVNLASTIGIISFQLVGGTGRYGLASVVGAFGSWIITLPLAAICALYFHFSLESMVSCVAVGGTATSVLLFALLKTTNWTRVAQKVQLKNAKLGFAISDVEDGDDSSCDTAEMSTQGKADCESGDVPLSSTSGAAGESMLKAEAFETELHGDKTVISEPATLKAASEYALG